MKNKLRYEFMQINTVFATVIGLLFLSVDLIVWLCVGSPVYFFKFISSSVPTIPTWLFGLFDFISFALLGFSLGAVLGIKVSCAEVSKYRGAFYFVIGSTLAYVHHALFFGAGLFFVSMTVQFTAVFFLSIANVNFYKVSKIAFILGVITTLWCIYELLFNMAVFFSL